MAKLRGVVIQECVLTPTAEYFPPGGVDGLTDPALAVERDTRVLYAKNASGTVLRLTFGDKLLAGQSTHAGNANYLVLSLNGTLDDTAAFGLVHDVTGADPDLYISAPGASIIALSDSLSAYSCSKGLILPNMTTAQRDAISGPIEGTLIYNTTTHKINVRTAATWEAVTSG